MSISSSTIDRYSKKDLSPLAELFQGQDLPTIVKDVTKLASMVRFIETKGDDPLDKNIEFRTPLYDLWSGARLVIEEIFTFLTDQVLTFKVIRGKDQVVTPHTTIETPIRNTVLFSGGLDSLVGAMHLSQKKYGNCILVHSYHKSTPRKVNLSFIADSLKTRLFWINEEFKDSVNYRNWETTEGTAQNLAQTRTLTYILNSIPVAIAFSSEFICIPENGPLTINIPFSKSLEFTRTTNPEFIQLFNELLEIILPEYSIHVSVPFRDYTKSEMLTSVKPDLIELSHSCSTSPGTKTSCSYCLGCLYRRLSIYDDLSDFSDRWREAKKESSLRFDNDVLLQKTSPSKSQKDLEKAKAKNILYDLLFFASRILANEYEISENSVLIQAERTGFYSESVWSLLNRFAQDIFTGLTRFYAKQPGIFFYKRELEKQKEILRTKGIDIDSIIEVRPKEINRIGKGLTPQY